jgi:hypothetical protein
MLFLRTREPDVSIKHQALFGMLGSEQIPTKQNFTPE